MGRKRQDIRSTNRSAHMPMKLIGNMQECYESVNALMASRLPLFLARVGGSDTDAVVDYLAAIVNRDRDMLKSTTKHVPRVSRFNGFYAHSNTDEMFFKYCAELLRCYLGAKYVLFCNAELLSLYFPKTLNKQHLLETVAAETNYRLLISK